MKGVKTGSPKLAPERVPLRDSAVGKGTVGCKQRLLRFCAGKFFNRNTPAKCATQFRFDSNRERQLLCPLFAFLLEELLNYTFFFLWT